MNKLLVISSWFVVFFVTVFLPTAYQLPTVYAADSTPSADFKSRLEELKKEVASKVASRAAQLKQEISNKLKDKAYIGNVTTKSDTSITIAAASGPKMISINQDTVFETQKVTSSKNKKSTTFVNQNDYIVALGDSDEAGVLIARKVILLPTSDSAVKTYLWGQVISRSDNLINLRDKDFKNISVDLPASAKVNINDTVVLTGRKNEEGVFEAEFMHLITPGELIKPKKIATPSAKLSTPSATPNRKK